MKCLELFAGAGGLAMGVSMAGFGHAALVEWDAHSCDTLRFNKERGMDPVRDWPLLQQDARSMDYRIHQDKLDLISGGPPCQPFSLGGKHKGDQDHRDMFPEAVRAVRETRPKAFLFENVKGLLRESFAKYFEYITLQLSYPEMTRKGEEHWTSHLSRLERHHTHGRITGLRYKVVFRLLNAADYGVPQHRERVIIVGIRDDLQMEWSFPDATHSAESLRSVKTTGEYWDRHHIPLKTRPETQKPRGTRQGDLPLLELEPWRTVRDALSDLPAPRVTASSSFMNHILQPGARAYHGHTGSPLDEPAKTLKAGDHGVRGGENMMVMDSGAVRYLTVRESARLQTFPDEYGFRCSWTESMRQLGNAVPVGLAHTVASHLGKRLKAWTSQ